jgi:2,5-diketo-D-gluconate reductase B
MLQKTFRQATVPALGLGTFRMRGDTCRAAVADALAVGYRHIDTARAYRNEADVGRAIAESGVDRDDVFLTTKIPMDSLEPGRLTRAAEASLEELGQSYVDLLLIHWPSSEVPLEASLDAMMDLQRRGLTRHIGVSNFTPTLFERALALAPVICNQVEYHPYLSQRSLLRMCAEQGLMLTAYRSFANGEVHRDAVLREVGARYGKSAAQVTLRWQIQKEPVVVIPKAASAENRRANLDVFDFELTAEDVATIDEIDREERFVDPHWAPEWEEQ